MPQYDEKKTASFLSVSGLPIGAQAAHNLAASSSRRLHTVGSKLEKMILRPGLVLPASYKTCRTLSTYLLTSCEGPVPNAAASERPQV